MGNSSSTTQKKTQEQKDIQYLGDRVPFGDAELRRLYRCFYRIEKLTLTERTSFLSDWAVHAAASVDSSDGNESTGKVDSNDSQHQHQQQDNEERALLMNVVEAKILPPGFGNRLYATAFLRCGESSVYDNATTTQAPPPPQEDEYTRVAKLEQFFEGLSNCGRRGNKQAVKVLFHCCTPITEDDGDQIDATELIQLAYRIALASTFWASSQKSSHEEEDNDMTRFLPAEDPLSQQELTSFAKSIVDHAVSRRARMGLPPQSQSQSTDQLLVTCDDVLSWVDDESPLFAATLSTFMFRIFCPGMEYPPSRTEFVYPVITQDSAFFDSSSSTLLFVFACLSASLGGHYHRLYTSLSDGLSFNRLQNALLGYGGPTLLVIRSTDGDLFGAFTASTWRESKEFFGNSDAFLFQLLPKVAVYRPSGNATNYQYCNSFARSRGYDKQAHGIGFGGTVQEPRLFIAEAWDSCCAGSRDLTFENGALLGTARKHFDLEALEVFGVGGEEVVQAALGDRMKARAVKDAAIRKARKVDKAAFLDDFRSGVIDSKAFAHRQQVQGRADADLEDLEREQRQRGGGS